MPESKPPRRPRLRMALGRRLPTISGRAAAIWLFVCLFVAAALIPFAIRRPAWIEAQFVLIAWWAIWMATLAFLLHREYQVVDDHQLKPASTWGVDAVGSGLRSVTNDGCFPFVMDGEIALIALGIFAAIGAVWFVVELAIPALTFVVYMIIRGMLAKVANDAHGCGGRWGRSLAWGSVWATIYTAPLALGVWGIHRMVDF